MYRDVRSRAKHEMYCGEILPFDTILERLRELQDVVEQHTFRGRSQQSKLFCSYALASVSTSRSVGELPSL